jgi:hypothetical protein
MNEEQDFTLADISACTHCRHYLEHGYFDTIGAVYCNGENSPYYHDGFTRTLVPILEKLGGCADFSFRGEKISQELYRHLPSDSPLRDLDLGDTIMNWGGEADLMSTKSTRDVLSELMEGKVPSQIIEEMVPAE